MRRLLHDLKLAAEIVSLPNMPPRSRVILARAEGRSMLTKFGFKLAYNLPPSLVYMAGIQLVASVTTRHGDMLVPELSAMDAIGLYEKDHGLNPYTKEQPLSAELAAIAHHLDSSHGAWATDQVALEVPQSQHAQNIDIPNSTMFWQIDTEVERAALRKVRAYFERKPQDRIEGLFLGLLNRYRRYRGLQEAR